MHRAGNKQLNLLRSFATILVSMAAEKFDVKEEQVAKQPNKKNYNATKIHNIRKDFHKTSSETEEEV